jgi:hypothetical protein
MKPAAQVYCAAAGVGLLAMITVSTTLTYACIGLVILACGMDI